MDLLNEDLEECVEKFEHIFSYQKLNKKNQNELMLLLENLSSELQVCKKSENMLRINLNKLLETESGNINHKYIFLEEKCTKLEIENKMLRLQQEETENLMQTTIENQRNDFSNKIESMQAKFLFDTTNLRNQLESNRICFEAKEKELHNEIQMSQAASALEWDEKESNLKQQLAEMKNMLRQSQHNECRLKCELNQLRNQFSQQTKKNGTAQNNVLYFRESPIKQIKNNLMQRQYVNKFNKPECFEYYGQSDNNMELEKRNGSNLSRDDTQNEVNQIYSNISHDYLNRIDHSKRPSSSFSASTIVNELREFIEAGNKTPTSPINTEWQQPDSINQPFNSNLTSEKSYSPTKVTECPPKNNLSDKCVEEIADTKTYDVTLDNTGNKDRLKEINTEALQIDNKSMENQTVRSKFEDFGQKRFVDVRPLVHKGSNFRKNYLPPLKPCSDVKHTKNIDENKKGETVRRKRKLYNPDNYTI